MTFALEANASKLARHCAGAKPSRARQTKTITKTKTKTKEKKKEEMQNKLKIKTTQTKHNRLLCDKPERVAERRRRTVCRDGEQSLRRPSVGGPRASVVADRKEACHTEEVVVRQQRHEKGRWRLRCRAHAEAVVEIEPAVARVLRRVPRRREALLGRRLAAAFEHRERQQRAHHDEPRDQQHEKRLQRRLGGAHRVWRRIAVAHAGQHWLFFVTHGGSCVCVFLRKK